MSRAIARRQLLAFEYYKENEDEFSARMVEPYALINGREGWYVASFDPARDDVRHFRLDRIKSANVSDERFDPAPDVDPAADVDGWPRPARFPPPAGRASGSPPSAPDGRARNARVLAELEDGAVIVELGFAGVDWLVREVLKEAGDAVVLEPEDARVARPRGRRGDPLGGRQRTGWLPVSRREQIAMTDEEVAEFLGEQRVVVCATNGPGVAAPDAALVRDQGRELWAWTYAKSQKVRNLERDAAPRSRSRTASSTTSCAA